MNKVSIFLVLMSFAGSGFASTMSETATASQTPLLREGLVLNGTEGRLVGPDSNDVWFLELASDVNDYRVVVKAGTKLQLLPSAALEQMIADFRKDPNLTYQLWGAGITKYKDRNFIFPNYFLPLRKAERPEPALPSESSDRVDDEPEPQRALGPELTDSNNVLSIPPEILSKLKARRQKIADGGQRVTMDEGRETRDALRTPQQSVVVDRTGFLKRQANGRFLFVPDALGRNVGAAFGTLRLLPCEILELAELKQAGQLERIRFRIAGITTEYEGQRYLLLQKATPSYNYGNFDR